jgi:hypothetical protein
MLTTMPGWMSFGWWNIVDTHGKLLSVKNPAVSQFLTRSNQCAWRLLPYPNQRQLNILSWPFTLSMAHTQSLSQLSQGLKMLHYLVSFPSSTPIDVYLTSDINKGSSLSPGFTWSVYRQDYRPPLYLLHILLCYSLILKWIRFFFKYQSTHYPIMTERKQVFRNTLLSIQTL